MVLRDDLVADHLGEFDSKVVKDGRDPFGDAGHGGAGDSAGGGADAFDAGPTEHIGQDLAEICLRRFSADTKTLDGPALAVGKNLVAVNNRGARTRSATINSKNQTHASLLRNAGLFLRLCCLRWDISGLVVAGGAGGFAAITESSSQNIQASIVAG